MHRLVKSIALAGALILGGLTAACQPEGKECHCTQTSCNCPLPPPKPAASDTEKDNDTGEQIAEKLGKAHRGAHVARHVGKHVRFAMTRSSHQAHAAGRMHDRWRREAVRYHTRPSYAAGTPEYRKARAGIYRRTLEHRGIREVRATDYRAGVSHGITWRGRAQSYHGELQRHGHGHIYQPLPYSYRSRSRHYATSRNWALAERHRERRSYGQSEHHARYYEEHRTNSRGMPFAKSGRQERQAYLGSAHQHRYFEHRGTGERVDDMDHGERERDELYPEREYEAAPEPEVSRPAQSGGAAGHWTMSINAPEALDAWHGYGVDCPDWGDEQ